MRRAGDVQAHAARPAVLFHTLQQNSALWRGRVNHRRRSILIIAATTLVAVTGVWALWPIGRAFDRTVWLDQRQERARLAMADRIVARRVLDGKTRAEVIAMLGEPPPTAYFPDWDFVYRLGMERGFMGIDSEWLVVRLDSSGRAVDARIVAD